MNCKKYHIYFKSYHHVVEYQLKCHAAWNKNVLNNDKFSTESNHFTFNFKHSEETPLRASSVSKIFFFC